MENQNNESFLDKALNFVGDLKEKAEDTIENAVDAVKENEFVHKAVDAAGGVFENLKDKAEEGIEFVKDQFDGNDDTKSDETK